MATKRKTTRASAPSLIPTIFHERWWLDIACDGRYREVEVRSGGHTVGRLPYRISTRPFGMHRVDMPALVHFLGPAVDARFTGDRFPHSLKQFSIIQDLLAQLPPATHISFRLHGGLTNTLPFDAAGFRSSTSFTVLVAPAPIEVLWQNTKDKTRNIIRRAQESLHLSESAEVGQFLDLYQSNLSARSRVNFYDRSLTATLLTECLVRRVGRILQATDHLGTIQAAIFTMWDHATEYYFMSTRKIDSQSGAVALLLWEALQHASESNRTFDMDGLHVVDKAIPNLLLLTGFGGVVTPRFQVQKLSRLVQAAKDLKSWFS